MAEAKSYASVLDNSLVPFSKLVKEKTNIVKRKPHLPWFLY